MRLRTMPVCAAIMSCGGAAAAAVQPLLPVEEAIERLGAEFGALVTLSEMGRSREGRPLALLTLSAAEDPGSRPAVLIVAGLDPRHAVGPEAAVMAAERLAADHADLLERFTVYVAPLMNPDGAAAWAEPRPARRDSPLTLTPDDADRDGRIDEDGPVDLDGDGLITTMRVPAASLAAARYGLKAEFVIDPEEPRLMRAPDPAKGERATHAVLVEGEDLDGDGRIAEDGPGGVDLSRNFPYRWVEHAAETGLYPLSEPETRALADWALARENIVAVLVFGTHDNLVNVPEGGKMDWTGRVPLGVEADDRPLYEELSAAFKEITRMTGAPAGDAAGSAHGWAYAHLGVYSFATNVWVRPDLVKREERQDPPEDGEAPGEAPPPPAPEDAAAPAGLDEPEPGFVIDRDEVRRRFEEYQAASPERKREMEAEFFALPPAVQARILELAEEQAGEAEAPAVEAPPAPRPRRAPARDGARRGGDSEDAKWLRYSDEEREGAGFVEWREFEHPQLGPVEIGGFVPGFRLSPPAAEVPALADQQARLVVGILERLPRLVIAETGVRALGAGAWRLSLRLENDGRWPTRPAIARKVNRRAGTVVRIEWPEEGVVSGDLLRSVPVIPGGGSEVFEWTVVAPAGRSVTVRVTTPEFGEQLAEFVLEEGR